MSTLVGRQLARSVVKDLLAGVGVEEEVSGTRKQDNAFYLVCWLAAPQSTVLEQPVEL
jgi:hypothetical protein